MMNRRASLFAGLLSLGGMGAASAAGTLRFALGQSWGPPFVERVGNRIDGGLLPDLMTAIATELGRKPEFLLLPPARVDIAMEDGSVDLHCLLSPSWWPEIRDPARWSTPLMRLRDVLVSTPSGPPTLRAVERQRWTVSTVRGYKYPTLDAAFAQGRLQRDDALDQSAVLAKLARGRTPLGIVNETVLADWQQRHPNAGLRVVQVVDEVEAHCLLGGRTQVPAPVIQQAIRRLVSSGRLHKLLLPYGAEHLAIGVVSGRKEAPR
jgi:ABC-type amino acid transport substrate-binding protein